MDREELIDRFIRADQETDLGMWKACYYAWELFEQFGMYSRDTVSILREKCNLDYDAIYNRRNAWDELHRLYPDKAIPPTDKIPHPLKASHFYRLHRLRGSIDITDTQARSYMHVATEYGWSSGQLCDTIAGNHDGNPVKTFMRKTTKFVRSVQRVCEDSERLGRLGLPQDIMKDLYNVLKRVETWLEAKKNEPENSG